MGHTAIRQKARGCDRFHSAWRSVQPLAHRARREGGGAVIDVLRKSRIENERGNGALPPRTARHGAGGAARVVAALDGAGRHAVTSIAFSSLATVSGRKLLSPLFAECQTLADTPERARTSFMVRSARAAAHSICSGVLCSMRP